MLFGSFLRKLDLKLLKVRLGLIYAVAVGLSVSGPGYALDILPKSFKVFDCTVYGNKPEFSSIGIEPVDIIYADELYGITSEAWTKRYKPGDKPDGPPTGERLSKLGDRYGANSLVVLDYESLKAYGVPKQEYIDEIAEYVAMARRFKAGKNGKQAAFGYYGVPPIADRGRVIHGGINTSLRADNDLLKPLVDEVDVLFPSLYTWSTDIDEWKTVAAGTLAEARRISQGKPVYAFIWPRYHESNKSLSGQWLPREMWRQELEYLYKYADGIVIWDGSKAKWDQSWPWWQETQDFLHAIGKF